MPNPFILKANVMTKIINEITTPLRSSRFTRRKFIAALAATFATVACDIQTPLLSKKIQITNNKLTKVFDGRFVIKGDSNYESWRQSMPWQMWKAERFPQIIARPNTRQAVVDVINFANDNQLKVAIKSGGHNVSEAFLRDGGLLLDLGELQAIDINKEESTAWVEPALWSHLLIKETSKFDLAFPVSHCASVPMGGYLLGGGVGINGDEWGTIACHSILAAEVITAEGKTLTVSPEHYPDIYWAVRGAGTGFFGVVTRFKLKLYPLPSHIYDSRYFFPLKNIEYANKFLADIAAQSPAKTELMMLLAHNPMSDPDASPEDQKVCVARIVTFANSENEANELLHNVKNHPLLSKSVFKQEMMPSNFQQMSEDSVNASAGLGFGRYAVDTVWTNNSAESLLTIKDLFASAPDNHNHVVVSYKINPKLRDDAAFSMIGDVFIGAYAVWNSEEKDVAQFEWVAKMGEMLQPYANGQYINEVNGFIDPDVIKRCFNNSSWMKLRALKEKYDPKSRFHDFHGFS
jgi:FAD/FMN-containing dehydrogenase